MVGDIGAADRWTAQYEAQQRAARGPVIFVDDEPSPEFLWTNEEFEEMQAGWRAERERKRQGAEGLLIHNKRSRNN